MDRRHVAIALVLLLGVSLIAGIVYGFLVGLAFGSAALSVLCIILVLTSTRKATPHESNSTTHTEEKNAQSAPEAESSPAIQEPTAIPTEEVAESHIEPLQNTPEEVPASPENVPASPKETASYDYEEFCSSLLYSANPALQLQELERSVQERQNNEEPVHAAELFLAHQLQDTRALATETSKSLPTFFVVRLHRSGLFYLKTETKRLSYGSMLQVLYLESALNALYFAHEYYHDFDCVTEEDLYKVWQRTRASICGQAPKVDTANWSYLAMPWQVPMGPSTQGEWAVRYAFAEAVEALQVPYRLDARFRCNVSAGDVAIEFLATSARAFPRSAFVPGIGIVPTTLLMRKREACAYAARLGILLASHAFHASPRIARVWISAIDETPTSRSCLFSACMERKAFARLNTTTMHDPISVLRSLGASLEEDQQMLLPVTPLFYLEDEQFCPKYRHDLWNLSNRVLPVSAAQKLGASRVSGLVVHEELPRSLAADNILRNLAPADVPLSTQATVHAVLQAAHETSDMSVWAAAEHVANELINDTLDPSDPEALRNELIEGDTLTKAVDKAQRLLANQNPEEALQLIQRELQRIDAEGRYDDTRVVAYRSFSTFTERILYHRLHTQDERNLLLVPDSYVMAHLLSSAILSSLPDETGTDVDRALFHARRAVQIAPLNESTNLGLAACLEGAGDSEGAAKQLRDYLEHAFVPHGIALAYLKLAALEDEMGHRTAADACYQRCVQVFPHFLPFVMGEISQRDRTSSAQEGLSIELMDEAALSHALKNAHIPLAPTPKTAFVLYDSAMASIDAEVFPVAHELMRLLELFTGDDVIHSIRLSLEQEPDA